MPYAFVAPDLLGVFNILDGGIKSLILGHALLLAA